MKAVIASTMILAAGACVAAAEGDPVFPLLRELAGERELPPPFGISLTAYQQAQGYRLTDLTLVPLDAAALSAIGALVPTLPPINLRSRSVPVPDPGDLPDIPLPGIPSPTALVRLLNIDNRVSEFDLQFDLWMLPFLNFYTLAGQIDGSTRVSPAGNAGGALRIDYDGLVYGFGAVLCYGIEKFFASVNTTVTQTELSSSSSSVGAWVVMPQVGMHVPWGAVWAGAMYQQANETQEGVFGGKTQVRLNYDASLEDEESWNYLCGMRLDCRGNWHVDLQFGGGGRRSTQASVSRRF
jgi:hypothetical protein